MRWECLIPGAETCPIPRSGAIYVAQRVSVGEVGDNNVSRGGATFTTWAFIQTATPSRCVSATSMCSDHRGTEGTENGRFSQKKGRRQNQSLVTSDLPPSLPAPSERKQEEDDATHRHRVRVFA